MLGFQELSQESLGVLAALGWGCLLLGEQEWERGLLDSLNIFCLFLFSRPFEFWTVCVRILPLIVFALSPLVIRMSLPLIRYTIPLYGFVPKHWEELDMQWQLVPKSWEDLVPLSPTLPEALGLVGQRWGWGKGCPGLFHPGGAAVLCKPRQAPSSRPASPRCSYSSDLTRREERDPYCRPLTTCV